MQKTYPSDMNEVLGTVSRGTSTDNNRDIYLYFLGKVINSNKRRSCSRVVEDKVIGCVSWELYELILGGQRDQSLLELDRGDGRWPCGGNTLNNVKESWGREELRYPGGKDRVGKCVDGREAGRAGLRREGGDSEVGANEGIELRGRVDRK